MKLRIWKYEINLSASITPVIQYTEEEIIELDRRVSEYLAFTPEKAASVAHFMDLAWEMSAYRKICRMLAGGDTRHITLWHHVRNNGVSSDTLLPVFTSPIGELHRYLGTRENPLRSVVAQWRLDLGTKVYRDKPACFHYKYKKEELVRDHGFVSMPEAY